MNNEKKAEQQRVAKVIQEIDRQINATAAEYETARQERSSVEKNYVQNARINTFEVDDQMETNAEVQQQKQLVAKNVTTEQILKQQLTKLTLLKDSPYFGRIDIIDPGETTPESLYIGTASLNDETGDFLIYDWRAPISAIFYNGNLGQVKYETPMGTQETELVKKRQFTITGGQIKHMFDTNDTVGDAMLQAILGEHSDEYMKNIVATIQQEQNDIIRDTSHDLLLVQGVAGSGKTSAILQRIAFLLYHSDRQLAADQIVLFSPNLLFSHYISEVLPSLGEKNMRQTTLAAFFSNRFQGLFVENLFDRYERLPKASKADIENMQIKENHAFIDQVLQYIETLAPDKMQFSDLSLGSKVIFSADHIRTIYQKLPQAMTAKDKFLATQNKLIKELSHLLNQLAKSSQMQDRLDLLSEEEYHELMGSKRRNHFQSLDQEALYMGKKLARKYYAPIYDGIFNGFFFDVYAQYSLFLAQYLPMSQEAFDQRLEYHQLFLEDCAPILFMRDLLTGGGQNRGIKHLFIDEMQDYPESCLLYLKHAFPKAKLTLLGDSEQAIFNPLEEPKSLLLRLEKNLQAKNARIIELNTSYRSTKQITDFMKAMLPNENNIKSFTRNGPKPRVLFAKDAQVLDQTITDALLHNDTVALITKDLAQAKALANSLANFKPNLLNDQDTAVPKGLCILPIYLAKGLEFDAVIVAQVTNANYPPEDVGILYTICSRAMHDLTLICPEELPQIMQKISPALYEFKAILQKE